MDHHCNNCGVREPYHSVACPWMRGKPDNDTRAAWYAENKTSVPQEVERMSLQRLCFEWTRNLVGAVVWCAEEGVRWVWGKVKR